MPWVLVEGTGNRPSRRWVLSDGRNLLGSSTDAQILVDHPSVSRRHALLRVEGGQVTVEDLGSRNGTFLGNKRLKQPRAVSAESLLGFGRVTAMLSVVEERDLRPDPLFLPSAGPPEPRRREALPETTLDVARIESSIFESLPELVRQSRHLDRAETVQRVGAWLAEILPCFELEIAAPEPKRAVLFRYDPSGMLDLSRPSAGEWVVEEDRGLEIRGRFVNASAARLFRPAFKLGLSLVASADEPVRTVVETPRLERDVEPPPLPAPPSTTERVKTIYQRAAVVARGPVAVLILGESGTGKEVLARYIHRASGLETLVTLNCAALPKELLEAELFGIEAGVATGVKARPGKFELAHGGTLFLDEIGDMAPETQARILRVLQEGVLHRIGGLEPRPAEVRILAATNRDLESMIREGTFRADLYHRIADWVVELPPLRERPGDIPNLAAHFLVREATRQGRRLAGISEAAMSALTRFDWPGNIRQLEREIVRSSLFLGDGMLLDTSALDARILAPPTPKRGSGTLREILEQVERREIALAIHEAGGDTATAAERLGIGRSTLYRRLKDLEVSIDSDGAIGS